MVCLTNVKVICVNSEVEAEPWAMVYQQLPG